MSSPSRTAGLVADAQDLHSLRTDQQAVKKLHAEKADLLLHGKKLMQGADRQRQAVNDVVVREIAKGDGLALRGHELRDQDGLAEDRVAVLVPEILAIRILERFQLQGGLVVHQPRAVRAVLPVHGEVQRQHIVEGDVSGHGDASFRAVGIVQDASRHGDAGPVDESVLLRLAESLGEATDQVALKIEANVTDEILLQGRDDGQLVCRHILGREAVILRGRDGLILRHPLRPGVVVRDVDLRVTSRFRQDRPALPEQVVALQRSRILAGGLRREHEGAGVVVLRLAHIGIGGVAASHGLPEEIPVAGQDGGDGHVVDSVFHVRFLLICSGYT